MTYEKFMEVAKEIYERSKNLKYITDIYVSPETLKDIIEWDNKQLEEECNECYWSL